MKTLKDDLIEVLKRNDDRKERLKRKKAELEKDLSAVNKDIELTLDYNDEIRSILKDKYDMDNPDNNC